MSLRILAVMVMLLTAVGLGLIAFETTRGPHPGAEHAAKAVPTESVLVATHPLPAGTLARDTDFVAHSIPIGTAPAGVILAAPGATGGIRGALVRRYIDAGTPVLTQDILRPRDRGFLAAVLAPGMRAISVGVNAVTGVSGLIWPGDHVDVLLTQKDNARSTPLAERVFSETVLKNVRVIAIDQKIVQGASGSPCRHCRRGAAQGLSHRHDRGDAPGIREGRRGGAARSAVPGRPADAGTARDGPGGAELDRVRVDGVAGACQSAKARRSPHEHHPREHPPAGYVPMNRTLVSTLAMAVAVALPGPGARGAAVSAAMVAPTGRDPASVAVLATADTWVQVRNSAGAVVFSQLLHAGQTWRVPAGEHLSLTTGNAGGTKLIRNGVASPPLGATGVVLHNVPLGAAASTPVPLQTAATVAAPEAGAGRAQAYPGGRGAVPPGSRGRPGDGSRAAGRRRRRRRQARAPTGAGVDHAGRQLEDRARGTGLAHQTGHGGPRRP